MHFKFLPSFILLLMFATQAMNHSYAQGRLRIQIMPGAAEMRYSKNVSEAIRFTGNPVFFHDGAYLYCDSAWLMEESNTVDCFGKVRIKSSDTLNLYGNFLHYDGNTKLANLRDNVRLVDNQTTLTTDVMLFDRNTQIASYLTGGKIVNKDNTLTSQKGYYHTSTKEMYFKEDVVARNPDYKMNSDTLMYNTLSRITYFLGPTIIKGKDNYIYCENGEYNRVTNKSRFSINALLVDDNRRLTGDSLYYDRKNNYGKAVHHVVLTDTVQDVILKGNFGEYWRNKGVAYITDRALAILGDRTDTLFLHADTLKATFDTVKQETRDLYAYYNARFYRKDMQGACDSLYYSFSDSTITMFHTPVLWSEKNQLTADTIRIFTGNKTIKLLKLYNAAFIVNKDSITSFNQIRGKNMIGHFNNNKLVQIDVDGNAETIYYIREDNKNLIGINKAQGSRMHLYIDDNKIQRITYFDKPDGNMFPEKDMSADQRMLKGFQWLSERRPLSWPEIFKKF
jgi:lipopolysaccharide assembly outer membrane protein LptD (OstA)